MDGFRRLTGKEVPNQIYPFFWQHGEPHSVLREYMDQIAQAGMKGVCIEARPHPKFLQDGWWSDMDCILEKAKELGMKVWILDDSHFPTGYANGRIQKDYPEYLKWYLDMRRYDVQGPMKGARIDFKSLKGRFWEKPDSSEKILGVYMAQRVSQYNLDGDPVQEETFVDVTSHMDMARRLLTLDIPAGAYSIFVVYQTRKGGEEATKDYLNPLIPEATQVLIDEVYEPHYARYGAEFGKTILGFFSDEPRFGNAKGTEAKIATPMVLPWRDGLENLLDFEPQYLPLLWVMGQGMERDVRYKYMDLITRLYNESFTKVLGDWCTDRGVWYLGHTIEDNGAHARLGYGTGHYFRGQQAMDFAGVDVIGGQIVPGMNYHHDAFNTGGSNGEFYHYALAKLASSAAHLDPKKQGRAMCEAFGAYGWNEGLKMMKWIADHLMVRGINWLVPHAFDPKEFPDFDCPPHFYAHGHNPQFRYFSHLITYINRICGLFSHGTHPAKVGILYSAELEWCGDYMPVEKPARVLTEHQISFDFISADYLAQAQIGNGDFSIHGQKFEVLVVPFGAYIPQPVQDRLDKLEDGHVNVIYLVRQGSEASDGQVRLENLGDYLRNYRAICCGKPQRDLVVGEYVQEGQTYYMLFNESLSQAVDTSIVVKGNGHLYRYDAWTDMIYPAHHEMDLHLEPYESLILVECDRKMEGVIPAVQTQRTDEVQLSAVERVSFSDSFDYPNFSQYVPQSSFACVQALEGFEEKCGTLRYESTFDAKAGNSVELDLGEVYETAEVFVNGVSAGVRLCRPYRFDLSHLVKTGENQLWIEVTNTLGTAVRDTISHYLVIEPFGVQGPVKLCIKKCID